MLPYLSSKVMNTSLDLVPGDSFLSGNLTQETSQGAKRKLDLLHISPSKRLNVEDSVNFSSSPVMESTVVEMIEKTNTKTLSERKSDNKDNHESTNESVEELYNSIAFLKALVKTKEDIIKETESNKIFLEKKVTDLERVIGKKIPSSCK